MKKIVWFAVVVGLFAVGWMWLAGDSTRSRASRAGHDSDNGAPRVRGETGEDDRSDQEGVVLGNVVGVRDVHVVVSATDSRTWSYRPEQARFQARFPWHDGARYSVRVAREGFVARRYALVDRTTNLGDIVLLRSLRYGGTVVDASSQEPVEFDRVVVRSPLTELGSSARLGDDGRFAVDLTGVPGIAASGRGWLAKHSLFVLVDGRWSGPFETEEAGWRGQHTVVVAPSSPLRLRVVDTDRDVASASVRLIETRRIEASSGLPDAFSVGSADSGGLVDVSWPPWIDHATVVVERPGLPATFASVERRSFVAQQPYDIHVTSERSARLSVRVAFAEDRAPAVGADVVVQGLLHDGTARRPFLVSAQVPASGLIQWDVPVAAAASARFLPQYWTAEMRRGQGVPFRQSMRFAEVVEVRTGGEMAPILLERRPLSPSLLIWATFSDGTGRSVLPRSGRVPAIPMEGDRPGRPRFFTISRETTRGPDGELLWRCLLPQGLLSEDATVQCTSLRLWMAVPGILAQEISVDKPALHAAIWGRAPLAVRLGSDGRSLRVTVRDTDGRAVPNAVVSIVPEALPASVSSLATLRVSTDGEGGAVLTGLVPSKTYALSAAVPGSASAALRVGFSPRDDIELRLEAARSVQLTLQYKDGAPAARAYAQLTSVQPSLMPAIRARSDERGNLAIGPFAPSFYDLLVTARDRRKSRSGVAHEYRCPASELGASQTLILRPVK